MTLQDRLDCPHSYAVEDNKNLMCDIGETVCDGKLYEDCLMDRSFEEQMRLIRESEDK